MSEKINVGTRIKMTRRPYFTGIVKYVQLQLLKNGGALHFCRWDFKPDDWISKTPLSRNELEAKESAL